ncbi:pyridoxamine 5'-phosphate oxidase family protein [Clostridium bovifaecis]|uniref:Pyridoxamine 5'-phosphate oxidase family protein n=1 Tax=Clostridium bovifaecis TaxID=2184719 RepID=A0A6I6ESP4_9CLOT|nr:pyridoxamine 5'-phosphate oxidase family protein [Clostridium bovifaecis]
MDFLQEFNRIMENTNNIALATTVENIPNVRIVNFYYNPQNKGIVYFASFKGNPKTLEFSKNDKVAFTTVPTESSEHVRVTNATVQRSHLTIYDLKDAFIKKLPSYETLIAQAGDMLDVYEIHFKEAGVTLDVKQAGKITL